MAIWNIWVLKDLGTYISLRILNLIIFSSTCKCSQKTTYILSQNAKSPISNDQLLAIQIYICIYNMNIDINISIHTWQSMVPFKQPVGKLVNISWFGRIYGSGLHVIAWIWNFSSHELRQPLLVAVHGCSTRWAKPGRVCIELPKDYITID